MFKISYDKKITMVQGDTGVIRMRIHNYELSQGDEVRFAIVNKANPSILLCQHSDKKIVLEKQVTAFEKDGSARIIISPYDTGSLQPGKYLYEIQVKTKDGRIDTVVPLASFTLMDGVIQDEIDGPTKPDPPPSVIELRFKRLEDKIIPELENRITNVENEIDSVSSSLDNMANDLILTNNDRINYDLRHSNSGLFKLYNKPNEFSDFPITILTDGYNFHTTFDVANFKHTGGKIYYVDPINGNNGNDGLTESTAVKRVYQAYTLCSDGDTIILLDGTYSRDTWFTTTFADNVINKSINIIAKNKGKVTIKSGDDHKFTKVDDTNIYSTTRSNVLTAIDISDVSKGVTFELKNVLSIDECKAEQNTWYQDGSTFYVHMFDDKVPTNDNLIVGLSTGVALINSACASQSIKLYVDGINFIGGTVATVHIRNSENYLYPEFYAKDCLFRHGYSNVTASKDGVSLLGCNGYFQNCEVAFASKDGFNYHSYNNIPCNAIEVNCKGYCNGIGWEDLSCNGSTMHDGGKIIRLNCTYYNNQGGNVADASEGTVSLNLGCLAYDSLANSKNGYDADFTTQQAGAKMYLDNCKAFGSYYSIRAVKGSIIELNNCSYSTIELL